MATLKTTNGDGKYKDSNSKDDVINYILNPHKTPNRLIGMVNVDFLSPVQSMNEVSRSFGKTRGVQLRHLIVSFAPYENCDIFTANEIAKEFMMFIGQKYQAVYAVHENKENVHFHLVFNSVSYVTGERYRGSRSEHFEMMNAIKKIARKYDIYVMYAGKQGF